MEYAKPEIVDYGLIGQHTFAGSTGIPPKDTITCTKDTHADESCPT